ncbi:FtsX-like permease family protein [Staphylothermus hellenicus]|uniref:ABC3 transporter permease C-terminal domain-containing protein n=1 Tax=Staphylothermus hellenicus (strain DSM 12710 / JCM 10830 / BK20S6-10-b1 / P8) TaxID=591019 RepID=D7DC40_STAHD|nr:FtsX-like permease family protein [Staphylothermus hellenicus]ADI31737.1 protein of unknown function DUF214 [Staphylothermus hellenicus DSM 12710]
MNLIQKIFLSNKYFIVLFLIGIAVTSLIISAFNTSYLYVNDMVKELTSGLPCHAIVFYSNNDHPWILEKTVSNKLGRDEVKQYLNIYVESYSLPNGFSINDFKYNYSSQLVLMYFPGLNEKYVTTSGVIVGLPSGSYNSRAKIIIDNRSFTDLVFVRSDIVDDVLDKAFSHTTNISITPSHQHSPYTDIYKYIYEAQTSFSPLFTLYILVGDKQTFIDLATYADKHFEKYPLRIMSREISFTSNTFSIRSYTENISSGKLLLTILWFHAQKMITGLSVEASENRIKSVLKDLTSISQCVTGIFKDYLSLRLQEARDVEKFIRIFSALSILPSLTVIYLTTTRVPTVLVSTMRKIIALVRIRGISIKKIRNQLLFTMIIWITIGSIIGIFTGSLLSEILYIGKFDQTIYFNLLNSAFDPLIIISSFVAVLILITASFYSTFKNISKIQPREFTRPSIFAELPLIKKGLSRGSILLLLLSIYYIIRATEIVSPAKLLAIREPNTTIIIGAILLFILEPIMIYFGPVILIYSITKLLASYPDKLSSMISWIAKAVSRKYHILASRLIMLKPARIALLIVLGTFSTGIVLGGLVGMDSVNLLYDHISISMSGGVDNVVVKQIDFTNTSNIYKDVEDASEYINGSYTYALFLIDIRSIYGSIKPIELSKGAMVLPVWIMFIPGNFSKIVEINSALGYGFDFREAIKQVENDPGKAIFIANINAMKEREEEIIAEPISGNAYIKLDNQLLANIDIVGTARNIPAVGYIANPIITHSSYFSSMSIGVVSAQIKLIYPTSTGLIMNIMNLEKFVKNKNLTNEFLRGYLFIFVKGSVDKTLTSKGYNVLNFKGMQKNIDKAKQFMVIGFNNYLSTGISLFIVALIFISILTYTIIFENLYAYTLMRARGVPSSSVYRLCVSEALSMSIISVLPGIIIGLFLGYALFNVSFESYAFYAPIGVENVYGVSYILSISLNSLISILIILLLPIILSYIIVKITYKRVVREAIMLLGSHV